MNAFIHAKIVQSGIRVMYSARLVGIDGRIEGGFSFAVEPVVGGAVCRIIFWRVPTALRELAAQYIAASLGRMPGHFDIIWDTGPRVIVEASERAAVNRLIRNFTKHIYDAPRARWFERVEEEDEHGTTSLG